MVINDPRLLESINEPRMEDRIEFLKFISEHHAKETAYIYIYIYIYIYMYITCGLCLIYTLYSHGYTLTHSNKMKYNLL